jgi:GT2 family glycosyltransferase
MANPNRASIIIPTYKREDLLRNLLISLSKQQTEYPFDVTVVNDDPDGGLSPLELEFSDIALKVIDLAEDHGRTVARNTAVRNSTGDILIFLDDDMTVGEDFITRHMEAHVDLDNAVIGSILTPPEYASHPLARYIERQGARKRKPGEELPPRCFRTGNGSVSRELFTRAGMFDETLRTYGEDIDLANDLSHAGAKFVFAEGAVSYHHYEPDIDDMMAKLREWGRYTLPHYAHKHPGLAKALWLHLAEPVRFGKEPLATSFKKMGLRIVLTPPFYGMARLVYKCTWLGSLLFPIIDFIRVYNYLGAYRRALRDKV